jgi:hypothetical protein
MKLNIPERLTLLNVLGKAEGNLTTLRVVRDLQRLVGFDEDELKAIGFIQDGTTLKWNPEANAEREFLISPATQKVVVDLLKRLEAQGTLTMNHLPLYERFVEDSPKE